MCYSPFFSFEGCNRGFISRHDLADTIGHLHLCDSSPTMLEQAEVASGLNVTKLNMDEEKPKVTKSICGIQSLSAFQFRISVRGEFIGYGRVQFEFALGERFARLLPTYFQRFKTGWSFHCVNVWRRYIV